MTEIINQAPSGSVSNPSAADNLKLISDVFKEIENESVKVAELLFEYLIDVSDENIIKGEVPDHKDPKINKYLKSLNRLFQFSRKDHSGGFRIINRPMIQDLDKKTYSICMCLDGGTSLDILCDVANTENSTRTPSKSPTIRSVLQAFAPEKTQVEGEAINFEDGAINFDFR